MQRHADAELEQSRKRNEQLEQQLKQLSAQVQSMQVTIIERFGFCVTWSALSCVMNFDNLTMMPCKQMRGRN